MTNYLSTVMLGQGNAEDEQNLSQIFVYTDDYQQIRDKKKKIIIGERGSGKSAIFRMLEADSNNSQWTVSLTPDNISWAKLEKISQKYQGEIYAIAKQWEFALLLECFETVSTNIPGRARRKALIKDFDLEVKRSIDIDLLGRSSSERFSIIVNTALNILQKLPFTIEIKSPGGALAIKNREIDGLGDINQEHLPIYQVELIERTYAVLSELMPSDSSVHILIDQLDDHWEGKKSQVDSLCGLFSAIMNVREKLRRSGFGEKIDLTVFIRTDIYEYLKRNGLHHASKYTSFEHYLSWDEEYLVKLIEKRVEKNANENNGFSDLFSDEKIGNVILNRYVLSRIFPRPRDIIIFLSYCIDRATKMGHERISRDDVFHAESEYSHWRLVVIQEEGRVEYRYAEQLLDSLYGKPSILTPRELRDHLDRFKTDNQIPASDRESTKPSLIKKLVRWGVFGVKGPRETTYTWNAPVRGSFSPGEKDDVVIHPALWGTLRIKKRRQQHNKQLNKVAAQ